MSHYISSYRLSFCSSKDRVALTVRYEDSKDTTYKYDRLAMETGFNPMYPDIVCHLCDQKAMKCICHAITINTHQYIANPAVRVILEKFIKMFCFNCGRPFREFDKLKINNVETSRIRAAAKLVEKNAKCSSSGCPQYNVETTKSDSVLEFTNSDNKVESKVVSHKEVRKFMDKIDGKYYDTFELDKTSVLNAITNLITFLPIGMLPKGYVDGKEIIPDIVSQYDRIIKDIRDSQSSLSTETTVNLIKDIYALVVKPKSQNIRGSQFKPHNFEMAGKNGFIRHRAMTKRCPGTGRAVLAPAWTNFGDIEIPSLFTEYMFTEMYVNVLNISKIRKMVEQKAIVKYRTPDGSWFNIRNNTRIEYGMVVMRRLSDGDMIVFNRQPTLHSYSLMAYRAVGTCENVIRIHSSCTTPHGGDFDGDESNIKFMRYVKGLTECWTLMNVKNCILGIQGNYPTMAIVFNGIVGGYLLSIAEDLDEELVNYYVETYNLVDDGRFDGLEDKYFRSGKYICSLLLPNWLNYRGKCTIENGVITKGYLNKKSLATTEKGIVHTIAQFSLNDASNFITKAQYIFDDFLQRKGLTLGFDNYNFSLKPPDFQERFNMVNDIVKVLEKRKKETSLTKQEELEETIQKYIQSLMNPIIDNMKKLDSNLELVVLALLSEARGDAGSITSIAGCVGQQFYNNARFNADGQRTRMTPYEKSYSTNITNHGFAVNSYVEGLNPIDNIRNHQGARLSIIVQYLKTPEAGKIAKDLATHLSCLRIDFEGRVRGYKDILFADSFGYNIKYEMVIDSMIGKVTTVFDVDNIVNRLSAFGNKFLGRISIDDAKNLSSIVRDKYERYILVLLLFDKPNYEGLDHEIIRTYYSTRVSVGRAVGVDCCLSLSQPLTQIMLKVQHKSSQKASEASPASIFFDLKGLTFKTCCAICHPVNVKLNYEEHRKWSAQFEMITLKDILKKCIGNSLYLIISYPTSNVDFYEYWSKHKTDDEILRIQIHIDQRRLVHTNLKYIDVIRALENIRDVIKIIPSPLTHGGIIDIYFKTQKISNNEDRKELIKNIDSLMNLKLVDKDISSYKIFQVELRNTIHEIIEMDTDEYVRLTGQTPENLDDIKINVAFLDHYNVKFYPIKRIAKILNIKNYFFHMESCTLAFGVDVDTTGIMTHELSTYHYTKFYGNITERFMMNEPSINHSKTILTDPMLMTRYFGVESARTVMESLFMSVYEHSPYYVSCKHFRLISDYILSGKPRPINNIAFKKQRRGFVENCLYDDYASTLTNATCFPKTISTKENTETAVLFGNKITTGTGAFKIFVDEDAKKRIHDQYVEYMKNRGLSSCSAYLKAISTKQIVNESGLGTSNLIQEVGRINTNGNLLQFLLDRNYDKM